MRRRVHRGRKRPAERLGERVQQQLRGFLRVDIEVGARPAGRGVHHPALRAPQPPRLARIGGGPRDRAVRPAARFCTEVERLLEREHSGPARGHANLRDVPERATVRAEQRGGLRRRDGHGHGPEDFVLPPGVGLQLPAALARDELAHRDSGLDLQVARQRPHERAHARRADPPVLDRRGPGPVVFHQPGAPGVQHAGPHRRLRVAQEAAAARGDELCALVEGQVAQASRGEPAAEASRPLEYADLGIRPREFPCAREARHAGADHRNPHVIHRADSPLVGRAGSTDHRFGSSGWLGL